MLTSYEIARENSPLAGSQLIVEDVPGIVYCPACDAERRVQTCEWFICAECGGIASHIVQGKELEVVALEVEP